MPERPTPRVIPDTPVGPRVELNRDDGTLFPGSRLAETIFGHLADQTRRTVAAAKAGRVVSAGGEPGVLDVTPLRELLYELVEELGKLRPRQRVAQVLRLAADIIDSQPPTN